MSTQLHHPLSQDCGSGEGSNAQINPCLVARVFPELRLSFVQTFTVPSISLFSLECLEGREITTETEITSMVEEGFNNHILSVRVNSGWWEGVFLHFCTCLLCAGRQQSHLILLLCSWVICEHSNYRGRQFFLEPIEITNWLKFSSLQTVGSLFPVRQVSFVCFGLFFFFSFFVVVWFLQTAINRNVQKHLTAYFTTNVVTFAWWLMEVLTLATNIFIKYFFVT